MDTTKLKNMQEALAKADSALLIQEPLDCHQKRLKFRALALKSVKNKSGDVQEAALNAADEMIEGYCTDTPEDEFEHVDDVENSNCEQGENHNNKCRIDEYIDLLQEGKLDLSL